MITSTPGKINRTPIAVLIVSTSLKRLLINIKVQARLNLLMALPMKHFPIAVLEIKNPA